ncbi:phosphoribosyltransferase [Nocardioides sp. 616]|uniref:phosphoribosyltransferase n=1 Tax=Nocardioides sp. 616 TaxID=2268090 RepID=UPI000CE33814|nr:phosphoribosyltransferase [Nocardioides sp. 616]
MPNEPETAPWTGAWVRDRLDLALRTSAAPLGVQLDELVGLAVRRNPRRAHLLVSLVLGKHVPTDPDLVHGTGLLLGRLAAARLAAPAGAPHPEDLLGGELLRQALHGVRGSAARLVEHARTPPVAVPDGVVVLGYAETATALGHAVADALDVPYLHSTRRAVPGMRELGSFQEEHSHATSHLLLPEHPAAFARPGPLVLVDDELSTGSTALNTIRALHRATPRSHYVIAALVDLRSGADRERMARVAGELGTRIELVALAAGAVDAPSDVLGRGAALVHETESGPSAAPAVDAQRPRGQITRVDLAWPSGLREGGRHGFTRADRVRFAAALPVLAETLADAVGPGAGRVHVLGFEELMQAPFRLAGELGAVLAARSGVGEVTVTCSSTTRSPVLPVPEAGYAIRSALRFPAHDDPSDGPGPRFAYNLTSAAGESRFETVVLVVDDAGDTDELWSAAGLVSRLAEVAPRVLVVTVPAHRPRALPEPLPEPLRGPRFGSYRPDDVAWLLTDLSHVDLEAPTEEREEAIQSGGAHYAESLPVEFQPDAAYQALFTATLASSATRLARAVGLVTEQVLALRGPEAVLVSLARAGTPVGVLMRRWAQQVHGLELPHYAVSIVRGKGIDEVALAYLAAHHDPATVMFVDGWTGKGAITRELAASVQAANAALGADFAADLAVLADTGRCVEVFGTREDYLIPSACLNSTVSGLVSRTVLNDALIGPGDFHGAKFYADLASSDVSAAFVETVAAEFASVRDEVLASLPAHLASDRTATWSGWAAVEAVSREYGIGDANLVKPGVGETTRVLLRRVPWKVLVRADAADELGHIRLLADQRGVEVVEVPDLPYSAIGLIHPRFTRGATGTDGTAATAGVGA